MPVGSDEIDLPIAVYEGQDPDPAEPEEAYAALARDPELLDGWQTKNELARIQDIHLWFADLKKEMDFDSREEAEGARKLVERAGWELGTHGYKILQDELEEDNGDTE
jgi:hypothetical protein